MNIGALSYYAGFLASLLLAIMLMVSWRGDIRGRWFIIAVAARAGWCLALGLQEQFRHFPSELIWTTEVVRTYAWLTFLLKLLEPGSGYEVAGDRRFARRLEVGVWGMALLQLSYVLGEPYLQQRFPDLIRPSYGLIWHLCLALFGLVLVEQYFRNARTDLRWRIKFLCFALGAIFVYDFYLYADALLFKRVNHDLWVARGAIAALVTPLLAIAAARNPDWSVDIFVSRQVVFHSVTLLGAGAYMLLMATAGYYIREYGGEWGTVAQAVFLVGAFVLLALLLLSGQMRARLRVFFTRNFFAYAYDYRHEWLRIITTLSDTRSPLPLEERVIMVLGEVVESPSGVLWVQDATTGQLVQRATFGNPDVPVARIDMRDPIIRTMAEKERIINLEEMVTMPEAYEGLNVPEWLKPCANAWLLVPLSHKEQSLYGVLLLTMPRTHISWSWEAIDLVKTSGRLAASYLALEDAGRALAESRQFEGFNRLSAFVIHDLKNLIAQLTLVVRNAERHSHNPEFMRDAIRTVDHAVGKMNRLMAQLRNFGSEQATGNTDLGAVLRAVVAARAIQLPKPRVDGAVPELIVRANPDRLASALEHVIHNAQDATGKHGRVSVRMWVDDHSAVVEVQDDGPGMTEEFVRNRLFRPFDTTKGLTGMGIGAYESREYLRTIGGDLQVISTPGKGTTFTFVIPAAHGEDEPGISEVATA